MKRDNMLVTAPRCKGCQRPMTFEEVKDGHQVGDLCPDCERSEEARVIHDREEAIRINRGLTYGR